MNKFLLVFSTVLFYFSTAFSQTCGNDSVVSRYYYFNDDFDVTQYMYVDSFDLTNGIVYSSNTEIINNIPGIPVRSQTTFIRKMLSYNSSGDTIQYLELQGTGSGYTNLNKIEFTYTLSEKPISRINSHWNGSTWMINKSEIWNYDPSELILNYLISDSTGNLFQKNYFYSGMQQTSIQFQDFILGNWVNNEQYLITYNTSGIRDSLYVQRWDLIFSSWQDSIQSSYDPINYQAILIRLELTIGDTSTFYIDTLNNYRSFIFKTNNPQSTTTNQWSYYNNHLKLDLEAYNESYSSSTTYTYNNFGFLIRENSSANSSMGGSGSTTNYDSLSNFVSRSGSSSSGSGNTRSETNWTYASASNITISFAPLQNYTAYLCQGDSIQSIASVAGGCGNYTFSWSPSNGLSSDSIANPTILIFDSIQYTITITDSLGQTSSGIFDVFPKHTLSITFDSSLCSGCPVVLYATPGYSSYSWYRNDTLVTSGSSQYTAISSGIYHVEFNGYCDMVSRPVELTLSGNTRIKGHIYLDLDSDCIFNNSDLNLYRYGISPFLIQLERQSYSVILNVDSSGNFDLPIDTGNFRISVINPSDIFEFSCPDSGVIHTYIPAFGDTISGIDFGHKIKYNCNRLRVGVSSTRFRHCNNSTIRVSYYNEGSILENNPVVNLRIPTELTNITSLQTFTILPDNVYQFTLPPIDITGIGSFEISADVDCDTSLLIGSTLCIDADISPVNFCSFEPDSSWDGSYVRIYSSCLNDSACFTIYNIADVGSDMDAPSNWRLYANNVLLQQGTYQLLSGEDTTLCFASDGRTYRLEADQDINFPAVSNPNSSIERCGILLPSTSYSLNYILQSPSDNNLPFHNSYCNKIYNSFDPNEKSVRPEGYGIDHIIDPDERITYRIDFQNTGNDTAYSVKLIDNLNFFIDLTSIQVTASSHPYTFSLENSKLTWLFNPIQLPDSGTDQLKSQGYVEFSAKIKSTIPQGGIISNNAEIYFDFNNPIYTNVVSNKICNPEIPVIAIFPLSDFCSDTVTLGLNMLFPGTNPQVKWYVNGIQYSTVADTLTLTGLNSTDTIYATLQSNSVCAIINNVSSNSVYVSQTLPALTYSWPELISSAGISYQWYLDSLPIAGATGQSYTPQANGNYQVEVTYATGCSQLSQDYLYLFTSGLEQTSSQLKVYPNPSRGKFKVDAPSGNKIVSVVDLTGRNILQLNTKEKNFTINMPGDLSSGIYYLIVRSGEFVNYERIIIQP